MSISIDNFTRLESRSVLIISFVTSFCELYLDPVELHKRWSDSEKFALCEKSLCFRVQGGLKFPLFVERRLAKLKASMLKLNTGTSRYSYIYGGQDLMLYNISASLQVYYDFQGLPKENSLSQILF